MDTTVENKVKHTPGPWIIGEALDAPGGNALGIASESVANSAADGESIDYICFVSPVSQITENDFANAKLICSAPDLLEALQKMTAKVNACIGVLQSHIVPDGISDKEALSELYGLLDNAEIVKDLSSSNQILEKATK
jgi:hypothetical protein